MDALMQISAYSIGSVQEAGLAIKNIWPAWMSLDAAGRQEAKT